MKPLGKINILPEQPGVYLFKDHSGKIIYIGKANNIRDRVLGHYRNSGEIKEHRMLSQSEDVEYIITDSEAEALILEANLIKKNQPKYNILLKDDKKFPWIKVTSEMYPRIFSTRNLTEDGSRLFGPYTDSTALKRTLAMVRQIFPIRSCNHELPNKRPLRPCLNHQIGRCLAPCQGKVSPQEYRSMIEAVIKYISGRSREIKKELETLRDQAAAGLDFEQAAHWRDQLHNLESVSARQKIVLKDRKNVDFIAMDSLKTRMVATVLSFREGILVSRHDRSLEDPLSSRYPELLASFLSQYYLRSLTIPETIIAEKSPENHNILENILSDFKGGPVRIKQPANNTDKKLLNFARKQLQSKMEEMVSDGKSLNPKTAKPLLEIQQTMGLPVLPRSIVAFDISNLSGTDSVASAVSFKDGRPFKAGYRHFKMQGPGPNDAAMIREAVERYLKHIGEKAQQFPDLILVDGGLPQLNAALNLKADKGYNIPVAGLAKRLEELYLEDGRMVSLPRSSSGLHLMQRLRNEAHRFAQRYHHTIRAKHMADTRLTSIKGIGPVTAAKLFKRFGSIKRIASSTEKELAEVVGQSVVLKIIDEFKKGE
jgi:excinuclease ABC subunit C